jgi:hypothetical protein
MQISKDEIMFSLTNEIAHSITADEAEYLLFQEELITDKTILKTCLKTVDINVILHLINKNRYLVEIAKIPLGYVADYEKVWLLRNPACPIEALWNISKIDDYGIQTDVMNHPNCPPYLKETLKKKLALITF